jgi:sRNA-binding protein
MDDWEWELEEKKTRTQLVVARAMWEESSRKMTQATRRIDQLEETLKSLQERRGISLPHNNGSLLSNKQLGALDNTTGESMKVQLGENLKQATELIVGREGPTVEQVKKDPSFWLNLDVFHANDVLSKSTNACAGQDGVL